MTNRRKPNAALVAVAVAAVIVGLLLFLPRQPVQTPSYDTGQSTARQTGKPQTAADRVVVTTGLGNRSGPEAVAHLLPGLRDASPPVRTAAAEALAKIADPRSGPDLLRQLEREDDAWAAAAILRAVDALRLPDAAPAVVNRLGDPSPMVRLAAVAVAGRYTNANVVAGLARATADTNNSVRANASDRIAAIGEPAIPALLAATDDGHSLSRIYLIAALARVKSDKTVPALVTVLRRHEPNVVADKNPSTDTPLRVAVLDALAEIGEPAAAVIARDEIGKAGDLAFKSVACDLFLRLQSKAGIAAVTGRLMGWKNMVSEPEWNLWMEMLTSMDTPEAKESAARLRKHRESFGGPAKEGASR